jgi:hypothetical protein
MPYPLTAVSGYWIVKNKFDTEYLTWFHNTLKIDCPYVFFGNTESIELAKKYRGSLPTYYIECDISDFYTYKFKDFMITHERHCPSVELNMIWNEKLFLIERAAKLNPYNSEFFAWIDAGICVYRDQAPPIKSFPDLNKLANLPKDKFIFTTSDNKVFQPNRINTYYHYIAGTSYLLHKNLIGVVIDKYQEYLDTLLKASDNIYTDQLILTHIYNDFPDLFYCLGHDYGELVPLLY